MYAYRAADRTRAAGRDIDLSPAATFTPDDAVHDGVTAWIAHREFDRDVLEAVNLVSGSGQASHKFTNLKAAGVDRTEGIWFNGDVMLVVNGIDDRIYSFNVPDSDNADLRAITVAQGAGDPSEIPGFTAGSTTSTLTTGGSTEQITVAGETRQFEAMAEVTSPTDADTTEDGHQVDTPVGETTVTLRVTAEDCATKDHTLTVTRPDISDDPSLRSITVTPRDIIGFDPMRLSYHVGVASSVTQATINVTPTVAASTFRTTPPDANTPGIQVNLSDGANFVTITVTAESGRTRAYAVGVNRSLDTVFGWKAVDDLDGLIAAGNESPSGTWTDGATIWVTDTIDDKIYAYRVSDKARDTGKDFDTLSAAGNNHSLSIWSDGATMWVADYLDDKIYAYRMSDKERDNGEDFDTLFAAGNNEPRGIWSDGATMWVADPTDEKIYAYRMSDKERDDGKDFNTLDAAGNATPTDISSDGVTMLAADPNNGE